ncbi:phage Gp37/Gp68 family protein, partial [Dehalococcoidia bacterium]|nr:phage Gp37/Gp68 family protein [Dehalococcoidia bacterium]
EQGLDKPRGIFVCSMSDLFGIGIPLEWTEAILNAMDNKHDRFYILTKQPQNLIKFSPFPDNCFVGFTATTNEQIQYGLAHIADVEARVKYISFEPLLEKVSLLAPEMVDWVIIGGQSGPSRFHPPEEWIQEIEDACDKCGIPVFEKNNLRPSGALRQEMAEANHGK